MNDVADRDNRAARLLAALMERAEAARCVAQDAQQDDAALSDLAASTSGAGPVLFETVPPIVRSALRKQGTDDADIDDIIQHTLVQCWLGRSNATTEGEAVRFVQQVARNRRSDILRPRRHLAESDASSDEVEGPTHLRQVDLRDIRKLESRVLAALVESGRIARVARVRAFLDHRLDPCPPPDDPGPSFVASERVRIRNRVQKARSMGRKYLLELLAEHAGWFDEGELELLDKVVGEDSPADTSSDEDLDDRPPEQEES